MSLNKIIVGSEEWCGLPQLNIPAIKARVDSGAKTSALHAVNIIPFKKDGDPWVRYEVHPLQNDGKVVESIMRTAAPGEFRANIHLGGTAQKIKITPTERKIAILAAKTLNLKVAGVDIIRGKNSPLLLEVNSSPGLEGIEGVSTKDIAGTMIEAIEKDLKLRK
jgi:hypothetical protein